MLQCATMCGNLALVTTPDTSSHQTPDLVFAKTVERLREGNGWSQTELARRMQDKGFDGFHQTTISRVEKGSRPVRIGEAIALADIFERSLEWMYTPTPEKSDVDFYRAALDRLRDLRADAVQAGGRFLWAQHDIESFEQRHVTKPLSSEALALSDDYLDVLRWELDDLMNAVHQTYSSIQSEGSLKLVNERLNELWPIQSSHSKRPRLRYVGSAHDREARVDGA